MAQAQLVKHRLEYFVMLHVSSPYSRIGSIRYSVGPWSDRDLIVIEARHMLPSSAFIHERVNSILRRILDSLPPAVSIHEPIQTKSRLHQPRDLRWRAYAYWSCDCDCALYKFTIYTITESMQKRTIMQLSLNIVSQLLGHRPLMKLLGSTYPVHHLSLRLWSIVTS